MNSSEGEQIQFIANTILEGPVEVCWCVCMCIACISDIDKLFSCATVYLLYLLIY